jgi:4-amino-4-deoxychorismate lyase
MQIVNGIIQKENYISENAKMQLDNGFNFGRGVFETLLVNEKPIFLEMHLNRMNNSLKALKIGNFVSKEYIEEIIKNNEIKNCVLKIIATQENVVIYTRKSQYTKEKYDAGFRLKISTMKRNPYSHVVYHKTLNYTDNLIEKEIASEEGFDEVIFFNTDNKIAEGSVSNLFFVKNGMLHTPKISCGLLNGIVRDWVLENFECNKGEYSISDLKKAEEVFLTNSIMGIMNVSYIKDIGKFDIGNHTKKISKEYNKLTHYVNLG